MQNFTNQTTFQAHTPVIGILTTGSKEKQNKNYSILPYPYVNWIQQSGGRVVPIPFTSTKKELRKYFKSVNGIVFTGGCTKIKYYKNEKLLKTPWAFASQYLLNLTVQENKKGVYFPLLAICRGTEVILKLMEKQTGFNQVQNLNHLGKIKLKQNLKKSRLFGGNFFNDEDRNYMQNHGSFFFDHRIGYSTKKKQIQRQIKNFFRITSTSLSSDKIEFASTLEAKKYPIYLFQFHPEKIDKYYPKRLNLPKAEQALNINQKIGQFFINEASKNNHKQHKDIQSITHFKLFFGKRFCLHRANYKFEFKKPCIKYICQC